MSVELDIVPLAPAPTWGDVRRKWLARMGPGSHGPVALIRLGSDTPVSESEVLSPPLACRFDLGAANTLTLMVMVTAGNYDEEEFLGDYGRNLSADEVRGLSAGWRDNGYFIALTSFAGRADGELEKMVALAVALAEAVGGRVVLPSSTVFNRAVGAYTSDEFAEARPI